MITFQFNQYELDQIVSALERRILTDSDQADRNIMADRKTESKFSQFIIAKIKGE